MITESQSYVGPTNGGHVESEAKSRLASVEFRRFLHAMVLLPVQIVRQGRKIIYRLLGYNPWLKDFFSAWEFIRRTEFA